MSAVHTEKTKRSPVDSCRWDAPTNWIDFDLCCVRLKFAKDDPALCKWATLQRLEELIEQATKPPAEREGFKK
jgi:hypothetical protein